MAATVILGNGLSVGFDERLFLGRITAEVRARLGADYTETLDALAELAQPEDPEAREPEYRRNFERLAGPLDRLAHVLTAVEPLLDLDVAVIRSLRVAAVDLRRHYLAILGTVLSVIDECCVVSIPTPERRAAWDRMNVFGGALVELHQEFGRSSFFTLNYDSLLFSAMLERSRFVYDGFRYGELNEPLDQWAEPPLFHLHGSITWVRTPEGVILKRLTEEVRAQRHLQRWAAGDGSEGLPVVVLGDLKTRQAERHPIHLFYEELQRRLAVVKWVAVGGYGFGDVPLNREIARYLARSADNRLLLWSRSEPDRPRLLRRLTLPGHGGPRPDQVVWEEVQLPDPAVVHRLRERLRAA
jgi:hypothetical protein